MWDGLQILKEVIDAGATIHVLDRTYIDLTSPIGRGFMAFISAMAEDELCASSSAPTKAARSPARTA
jgi:DNA invertase Pin-like site-specific DNA recombinase